MCSIAVIGNLTRPSCDIENTCNILKELIDARDGNTINYFNSDELFSLIKSICTFLTFHHCCFYICTVMNSE